MMMPVTAATPATAVLSGHRSLYAAPRPLRRHWRVRNLILIRRVDLRPGERERKVLIPHFLDRWLSDPIARPALLEALRCTTRSWYASCGCLGDQHRKLRSALLEAFRRRELVLLDA